MKDPAATLQAASKLEAALTGAQAQISAILGVRSKTVNIPPHMREKMKAFRTVCDFWTEGAGATTIYPALLEEQKSRPIKGVVPKARGATGG